MTKKTLTDIATRGEMIHFYSLRLVGQTAGIVGFFAVLKQLTEKHGPVSALLLVGTFFGFSSIVGMLVSAQPTLMGRFRVGVPADTVVLLTVLVLEVRGLALYLLATHYGVQYYCLGYFQGLRKRLS